VAWALGGNLYGANPDAAFAQRSLAAIGQVVYLNTTLNTGHIHGRGKETWVLPVLARDEEPEPTTQESMFSYVRFSDGGPSRHAGPRSEVQVIADIAHRVLGDASPVGWRELASAPKVRETIARVVPGLEPMADIDRTKKEFHIAGRALTGAPFKTADGRATLFAVPVPRPPPLGERELNLMTIRSEGQFNTVVYEDHDRYRGTERRDVILISPADRQRLGLAIDQLVTVRSAAGEMTAVRVREFAVRDGNAAMYYPEANVLVPRATDPASGTPSFKNVRILIV
jgi:anaerobic selenocysteine-containing dehydrogenase